jgi:hypothetical protein
MTAIIPDLHRDAAAREFMAVAETRGPAALAKTARVAGTDYHMIAFSG